MPTELQPVYDTMDAVPEAVRGSYAEVDGKAVFQKPITVELLPDVAGLKSSKEKIEREMKRLQESIKQFEGIDPAKVAEMQTELETLRQTRTGDQTKFDEQLSTVRKGYEDKLNEALAKQTQLQQRLLQKDRDVELSAATAQFEFISPAAKRMFERSIADLVVSAEGEDGSVVHNIRKGKDGVEYSKTTGEPMTLKEKVAEMLALDEYKDLIKGHGGSGSGGPGPEAGQRRLGKRQVTRAQMQDSAFYQSLKKEAEKAGKSVMDYVTVVDG